jgi:spore germination protein
MPSKIESYLKEISDGAIMQVGSDISIYFIKTLVNYDEIVNRIQIPYMMNKSTFNNYVRNISYIINEDSIIEYLLNGFLITKIEKDIIAISGFSKKHGRNVDQVIREASFEGGLESFVEHIDININLVRNLYKTEELIVDIMTIGKKNKKEIALLYNKNTVDCTILKKLIGMLEKVGLETVGALNELQQVLVRGQLIFPRLVTTERPDKAINSIDKGKIILMLEGTPVVAITPITFHEYFTTVDDKYLLPVPSVFLICLRYLALCISVTLPAAYVAFVAYNPEVFRIQLALSIAGSRAGVPYTSYIEVTFMLIMMEFLIEASLRLPKTIGSTATTVGGLILGQAVTAANLASEIMVIIVSAVAISTFVIPTTSMSLSIRVLKYFILFFTVIGGMIGFVSSMIITVFYLTSLNNFSGAFFDPANIPLSKLKEIFGKVKAK